MFQQFSVRHFHLSNYSSSVCPLTSAIYFILEYLSPTNSLQSHQEGSSVRYTWRRYQDTLSKKRRSQNCVVVRTKWPLLIAYFAFLSLSLHIPFLPQSFEFLPHPIMLYFGGKLSHHFVIIYLATIKISSWVKVQLIIVAGGRCLKVVIQTCFENLRSF